MKKKKGIFAFFIVFILITGIILGLLAYFGILIPQRISSFEDLKNIRFGTRVKLTGDIDCNNETIKTIECSSFDGQNYSIKNAVVDSISDNYTASLFRSNKIKNVVLENITVSVKKATGIGIVSGGDSKRIENVHVKNSFIECSDQIIYGTGLGVTVKSCFVGGIYGGFYKEPSYGRLETNFDCEIKNCSVDHLTVELSGYVGSKVNSSLLYVGGIAGGGNNISDCSVTNSTLTASATNIYNYPLVGGIVAYSEGTVTKCFTKDNVITANANYYSDNIFSMYSTSRAHVGGIVARSKGAGEVSYCFAENNTLNGNSSGDLCVGGLIGEAENISVSQCFTKGSEITLAHAASGNGNTVARRAGGLVGKLSGGSVQSCFAYNNGNLQESSSGFATKISSKVSGLVAEVSSGSISNCATYNSYISSTTIDEFIPQSVNGLSDCFVSATAFGNMNGCKLVGEDFWIAPNLIKSELKLSDEYWRLIPGSLPCFEFGEATVET